MPIRTMSGFQSFPLSTGSSDNPAFTPGSPLAFQLGALPRNLGSLAYYLYGIFVTFAGSVVQAGGAGSAISDQRIIALLVDYLQLSNAWNGSPLSPQNVKGYWLPTILVVGSGYNTSLPIMPSIPAAPGTYQFSKTLFIPLCLGNGDKPHHTAQLNVLYRSALFSLGCAQSSALAAFSTGATFSGISVRASAACLPEPEIRVGPGVEWIDYQQTATSGQQQVLLNSFGNNTSLLNSEQGAAIAFAMAMSNLQGQPGSFDPANITQIAIPFRSQIQTSHIPPLLAQQLGSMGERRPFANPILQLTTGPNDSQDWPYAQNTGSAGAGLNQEMAGLLGLPIVPQPTNMQLSKLQVVSGDTSYYMSLAAGPSGTHHTLVQHVRSWSPAGWAEALKVIQDSGLLSDVFGSNTGDLAWSVKMTGGKSPNGVSPNKLRFLPMALKPKAHALRQARK